MPHHPHTTPCVDHLLLAPLPVTEVPPDIASDLTHLLVVVHPLLVDTEMSVADMSAHLPATAVDMTVDTTVDMTDRIVDMTGTIADTTVATTAMIAIMADTVAMIADTVLAPALLQDAQEPSIGNASNCSAFGVVFYFSFRYSDADIFNIKDLY